MKKTFLVFICILSLTLSTSCDQEENSFISTDITHNTSITSSDVLSSNYQDYYNFLHNQQSAAQDELFILTGDNWGVSETGKLYLWTDFVNISPSYDITINENWQVDCYVFPEKIISANIGKNNSYALTDTGEIYLWGRDKYGSIGNGGTAIENPIKLTIDASIKQASVNDYSSLLVTNEGEVYRAGLPLENLEYSVDVYGGRVPMPSPTQGFELLTLPFKVKKSLASPFAYCFLSDTGEVYVAGCFLTGDSQKEDISFSEFTKLDFPEVICEIAISESGVYAISTSGLLYYFGDQSNYEIDIQKDIVIADNIYQKNIDKVKAISCDEFRAAALTQTNEIYYWGRYIEKSHGMDSFVLENPPVLLEFSKIISKLCMNGQTLSILDGSGEIYWWDINLPDKIPICLTN